MTNGIAIKQPTLAVELGQRQPQFRAALPAHIPVERFVRVVLTAIQTSPKLAQMDRASLWNACMRAAQDGLLPDGREGALVPFKGKVTWIPMVGGIRKKVRNSEAIATWDVHAVHAKDQFQFELGDDPYIKHKPLHAEAARAQRRGDGRAVPCPAARACRSGAAHRRLLGRGPKDRREEPRHDDARRR